jgi:hypothetical protein
MFKIFKFSLSVSMAVSLSVVFSYIFLYIVFFGFIAQLISLFPIFIVIYQLASFEESSSNKINYKKLYKFFFPIALIYFSYQKAFFVLYGITFISLIAYKYNYCKYIDNSVKFHISFIHAIKLFTICMLALIIISPEFALKLYYNTGAAYEQQSGWHLSLLSPLLFWGLPIPFNLSQDKVLDLSIIYYRYLMYLLVVVVIIYIIKYLKTVKKISIDIKINLISLLSLYIFFILSYIVVYYIFGSIYKSWKYATYALMPFSFVPLAVFALLLANLKIQKKMVLNKIILYVFLSLSIINYTYPLTSFAFDKFSISTAAHLLKELEILKRKNNDMPLFFDLNNENKSLIAGNYFIDNLHKISFANAFYLINNNTDTKSLFNNNYMFVSDRIHTGIYNSLWNSSEHDKIYIYDQKWLNENGFIIFYGVKPFTRITDLTKSFIIHIKIPKNFQGENLKLIVNLVQEDDNNLDICRFIQAQIGETSKATIKTYNYRNFSEIVSYDLVTDDILPIGVINNKFLRQIDQDDNQKESYCQYGIPSIVLVVNNPNSPT